MDNQIKGGRTDVHSPHAPAGPGMHMHHITSNEAVVLSYCVHSMGLANAYLNVEREITNAHACADNYFRTDRGTGGDIWPLSRYRHINRISPSVEPRPP